MMNNIQETTFQVTLLGLDLLSLLVERLQEDFQHHFNLGEVIFISCLFTGTLFACNIFGG